jgi:hypothetical protein
MKGLAVTILLAILEIGAITTSGSNSLLTDGPPVPASRKEEAGIQSEVLVDAERPDFADLEPAAPFAAVI